MTALTSGKFAALLRVMRFDKPIGTYLLLAPALWGLIIASSGVPTLFLLSLLSSAPLLCVQQAARPTT